MSNLKTPSKRINEAKKNFTPTRSTSALRNELRKDFFAKLRISRSKSIDKIRQIVEYPKDKNSQNILKELRETLLENGEADILNSEEALAFFETIEKEELEKEVTQYEQYSEMEINDILDRHLTNDCHACGKAVIDRYFCSECIKNFFTDRTD